MVGPPGAVRKRVVVRCDPETAFRTWTELIDAWWPKGHSISGNPATRVILEGFTGGRIFERTPEGVEHDWGKITSWEPPHHFAYQWYLGSGPDQPTHVDVHFTPQGDTGTIVDLHHEGPALIGELWSRNSARYDAAWEAVLPLYAAACNS